MGAAAAPTGLLLLEQELPPLNQLQSQPPWNTLWLKQLKDNSKHNGKFLPRFGI